MRQWPRHRRLCSDHRAMQQLDADSSVLSYTCPGLPLDPPENYLVTFRGYGLYRPEGSQEVLLQDRHQVLVRLGAAYPRMMPELMWKTPVFHPNISANGIVCLGGYSTHWVPSLRLDQLCEMLWDMIRYQNYDVESPYNREAAQWARSQTQFGFPLDGRSLRQRPCPPKAAGHHAHRSAVPRAEVPEILFMDDDDVIVAAELVPEGAYATDTPDILYIE